MCRNPAQIGSGRGIRTPGAAALPRPLHFGRCHRICLRIGSAHRPTLRMEGGQRSMKKCHIPALPASCLRNRQGLGGTLIRHGEIFSCQPQAAVFSRPVWNFLTPGGGSEKIPGRASAHCLRRAWAPKRPGVSTIFVALFSFVFATIPPQFCGCGSDGKDFAGCSCRRTSPSHPCGPPRGPHRWPVSDDLAWRTPDRKVPAEAEWVEDLPARSWCGTSSASSQPPRCAAAPWACGGRSIRREPVPRILDAGRGEAVSLPQAIASRQNKKLRAQ